jgi:hypothetical protein
MLKKNTISYLLESERQKGLIPLSVKEKLMLESPKKELEGEKTC